MPTTDLPMRIGSHLSIFVLFMAPVSAHASDLAEALQFAQEIMGDEAVDGYEQFVDWDPNEALPLLLSADVVPGEAIARYRDGTVSVKAPPEQPFATLGSTRLSFQSLEAVIRRASDETGLPAALIDAVIRTESGYRPDAVSRAGAMGLMQLMPRTARSIGVRDPFDPEECIMGGARYLRSLIDQFNSVRLGVAAYNAGPGTIARNGGKIPKFKETQRYVVTVMSRYERARLAGID